MSTSWWFFPLLGDDDIWLVPEQQHIVQLVILGVGSLLLFLILIYVIEKYLRVCWPNSIHLFAKRRLLRVKYTSSRFGLYVEMLYLVLSLYSCSLFLYLCIDLVNRAQSGDPYPSAIFKEPFVFWSEFVNSVLFGMRYLFMLLTSSNSLLHVLHPLNVADQFTIIPGLIGPAVGQYYWFFLCLRVIQFYRSLRFLRGYGWKPLQTPRSQLVFFFCTVATYLFCAAGFLFVVENNVLNKEGQLVTFLDAVYFTIVTLATVGYGDYTPKSVLGRLSVMILVVSALIIIPRETTKLIRIMHSQNTNTYTGEEHHVIVYAQDNCDVSTFIREFFYGERLSRDTNVALVTTSELHTNTKELLANPQYGVRVDVLKGDLSHKATLKRAKVSTAEAAFVLTPKHKQLAHYHHVDAQTILTALNLRTYNPNLEIFVQVTSREHKITALSRGLKHVVCMQELKLGLLAQTCLYPGFTTLISNLVYDLKTDPNKWKYNPWLREYDTGLNYNFYSDQNLSPLIGMTFTDAALYLFRHCQVTLLGIKTLRIRQTSDDPENTMITKSDNNEESVILLLNPGRTYVIQEGDVGLIVATHVKALPRGLAQNPLPTPSHVSSSPHHKTSNELHRIAVHEEHKLNVSPTDDFADSKQHDETQEAVGQNDEQQARHQQRTQSKRSVVRSSDHHNSQHDIMSTYSDPSSLLEVGSKYVFRSDDEKTQHAHSDDEGASHHKQQKSHNEKTLEKHLGDSDQKLYGLRKAKSMEPQQQTPARRTRKRSRIIPKLKKLKGTLEIVFDESLAKNYLFVEDEPTTLQKVTLYAVEERLKEHIVVICGPDLELYNLILPLRARYLKQVGFYKPIVLFSPTVPSTHLWNKLCIFPDIYFVRGSPTNCYDLLRAGVHNAWQVLILGSYSLMYSLMSSSSGEVNNEGGFFGVETAPSVQKELSDQVDSVAIIAFKAVVTLTQGRVVPIIELMYHENSRFLLDIKDQSQIETWEFVDQRKLRKKETELAKAGHLRNPLYTSGNVFYVSLFDTLICQAYYNIDLIDLLEELISPEMISVVEMQTLSEWFDSSEGSITYGEAFETLLSKENLLPLGLYRVRDDIPRGRFVFTSPPFDTPLLPSDKIFVLQQSNKRKLAMAKIF